MCGTEDEAVWFCIGVFDKLNSQIPSRILILQSTWALKSNYTHCLSRLHVSKELSYKHDGMNSSSKGFKN